jgi:hypothetical protein
MVQEIIEKYMKPIIEEVYKEGYKDGERRLLEMYRYGWEVGHADTMAALGEINIEEVDEKLDTKVFEEVKQ